jgi:hypothetical protein
MTNLFYPSVVVWYQKRTPTNLHSRDNIAGPSSTRIRGNPAGYYADQTHEGPLSVFSTPLLDSIFPDSPPLLPRIRPEGWWYSDIASIEGPRWNATSVGAGDYYLGPIEDEEVRMVTIAWIDVDSALSRSEGAVDYNQEVKEETRGMIKAIRQRVETWEEDHPGSREKCVRQLRPSDSNDLAEAERPCYLFSAPNMDGTTSFPEIASNSTSAEVGKAGFYQSVSALFRVPRSGSTGFSERWKSTMDEITGEAGGKVYIHANAHKDVSEEWRLSVCLTNSTELIK